MLDNIVMMRLLICTTAVTVALAGVSHVGPRILMAGETASPATPLPSTPSPDAAIQGVRMTETRQGELLWEVQADKAQVFEDRGIAILLRAIQPVRIVIYNDAETLISFAEKAVVDLKTKDLQLSGDVRSESSTGAKIFTDLLTWSARDRQIKTDAPVVIEKEGFHIQGIGMVADTILDRITIRERSASQVTLSGNREVRR